MKIKFMVLLFLFIASFSFSIDLIDVLEELTEELETSNELIIELREEVKDKESELKERPTKEEYNKILNSLEETTIELENSNKLLIKLRSELQIASIEIAYFREKYEELYLSQGSGFRTGIGATFPLGGEVVFIAPIPFFDFYIRAGISEKLFQGGVGLLFRY